MSQCVLFLEPLTWFCLSVFFVWQIFPAVKSPSGKMCCLIQACETSKSKLYGVFTLSDLRLFPIYHSSSPGCSGDRSGSPQNSKASRIFGSYKNLGHSGFRFIHSLKSSRGCHQRFVFGNSLAKGPRHPCNNDLFKECRSHNSISDGQCMSVHPDVSKKSKDTKLL